MWPLLLVLAARSLLAQEEGEAPAEECEDCEEAWQYVDFLKQEVAEKVEDILGKTLYSARELQGDLALEQTVSAAMDQVLLLLMLLPCSYSCFLLRSWRSERLSWAGSRTSERRKGSPSAPSRTSSRRRSSQSSGWRS